MQRGPAAVPRLHMHLVDMARLADVRVQQGPAAVRDLSTPLGDFRSPRRPGWPRKAADCAKPLSAVPAAVIPSGKISLRAPRRDRLAAHAFPEVRDQDSPARFAGGKLVPRHDLGEQ